MIRLAAPWLLVLLLPAAAAAWWMARRSRRSDPRVAIPGLSHLRGTVESAWVRMERGRPWIRFAALALLVLAAARPQKAGAPIETVTSRGVDIVVALDVSTSMRAEDFRPRNRLMVARSTVADFVRGRPRDRIGLVVFAALATTRCPLTLDHEMLLELLDEVDFAPPEEDGTALGMGLATAVNRLRRSEARSRVVVLVTDGRNNRGEIGPRAAAEAAKALGIRVYTVGVGTAGEAPVPVGGGRYVLQRLDLDEPLLKEMAATTGGRYFRATDPETLRKVFHVIDRLETSEIRSRVRVLYTELFPWFLLPAGVLLALEAGLAVTRLQRIP